MVLAKSPARVAPAAAPATRRLASLDIVRGVVMVLMAIDHVRVYSGMPAGGPTPGIFFTRWVTHFCAPAFVFFAGTAAFLYGRSIGATALGRYLATRGLLLVALEVTFIRFTWTFNLDYSTFVLAGVIWMLGWCMVLMAPLVQLRASTVGWIGVAIVFLQQLFGAVPRVLPQSARALWAFVYPSGAEALLHISVLYVIVPWIGVMAAGYGFGTIMVREPADRRRLCLRIGITSTLVFLLVAGVAVALSPVGPGAPPAWVRLLNQNKYPASQLFLLMTLGPTIAALPFAERARGPIAEFFRTFGRVPMFYYLLHIPTIHVAALIVNTIRTGAAHPDWYATAPFASVPPDQRWGLPLLYLVFVLVIAILYGPCRWYAALKERRRDAWLRYI